MTVNTSHEHLARQMQDAEARPGLADGFAPYRELVAAALFEADARGAFTFKWEDATEQPRRHYLKLADAALAALPAPHVTKQEPPPAGIDDAMAHACQLAGFARGPLPGVDYARIDARLSGRRLAFRSRVRAAVALLLTTGGLNRLDLIQIGEISVPQASADLAKIAALFPGLMTYDKSARRYVPGPEADAWRAQSVAQSVAKAESVAEIGSEEWLKSKGFQWVNDGGRDRDRTCDPHDVNVSKK